MPIAFMKERLCLHHKYVHFCNVRMCILTFFEGAPTFQLHKYFSTDLHFNFSILQFLSTYHFNIILGHTCVDYILYVTISWKLKTGTCLFGKLNVMSQKSAKCKKKKKKKIHTIGNKL